MLSLALLFSSTTALGSAQDLFGYGSYCPSVSNACLTRMGLMESVYYNPAGLSGVESKVLAFSYQSAFFQVSTTGLDGETPESPERSGGVAFGAAVPLPLPDPIGNRLALGLGLYIPDTALIKAQIPSPGTPWYPVIGNRSNTLGVHGALAVRILDQLHLGVGVKVLAKLVGEIAVSPGETGVLSSSIRDELLTTASPIAGITWLPTESLRTSLVYRGEERGSFSLPVRADLGEEFPLEVPEINIEGLAQIDPRQVAGSISWVASDLHMLELSLQWRNWAAYPQPIVPATPAAEAPPAPNFSDTWSPRIGGETGFEWSQGHRFLIRGGYGFEPSPAPQQNGETAHMDTHRHVLSAGLGWSYRGSGGSTVKAEMYGQEHLLVPRSHRFQGEVDGGSSTVETTGQIHLIGLGIQVGFP